MTHSVYVMAPEEKTGKSVVALGILDALTRTVASIGVFRPIVHAGVDDDMIQVLIKQPAVNQTAAEAAGVTYAEVHADPEEALARILRRYAEIAAQNEAVVIVGSDYDDITVSTELSFNARIAANLNVPVALTVSAQDRTPQQVAQVAQGTIAELVHQHAKTISVIATRVPEDAEEPYAEALRAALPQQIVGILPAHPLLTAPTFASQVEAVDGRLLFGRDEQIQRESRSVLVAAMTLPNVLRRLEIESTLIMPGDRSEMIPGVLLAHASGAFPQLTGLILVGGYDIPDPVKELISTVHHELPIALTDLGTSRTAMALAGLESTISNSPRKVELGQRLAREHIDTAALLEAMALAPAPIRTPLMFEYQLTESARKDLRRIVLPESGDERILEAASIVLQRGTANITLLGDAITIKNRASALGYSLDGADVVAMDDPELVAKFSAEYATLRAKKGVTLEQAREKMLDPSYFATMMVHFGMADGMVSGAVNTTANTIRPSLEFIKTKPGVSVVSSSFLMCLEDRVHVYGDCAVNPDPTAEQLADIAISSAATAAAFGIEPRVAMLSYSTGESGSGADVDKVRAATELVKERAPELLVEGPIQFDAAVDPTVGGKKMPGSEVAGRATVFIFPDLNTGNNTYKAVQRSAGALAVGPVLQGLNKPVNDLSRGALVDDIVNTIAITAIQAQHS
ncbi:MAG: phosphate acetyltransferase [Propioniciclava sp.]